MDPSTLTAIDVVEAAYNLERSPGAWLPELLASGAAAWDRGMGCAAAVWAGTSEDRQPLISQMHVESGPHDLALRFARAAREVRSEITQEFAATRFAGVRAASECTERRPGVYEALKRHVGCEDVLGVWALDPDLHGVAINIPSSHRFELTSHQREHWQMLAVHIAAGHRLRRGLGLVSDMPATPATELPLEAEALVDPTRLSISHAVGDAASKNSCRTIRDAAVRIDRARGKLRKSDPMHALELWEGLVRGRWSIVDWFDTDGRRFVLARPNEPHATDPRGLTDRERQVVTYASLGESRKMTGYRLGLSAQWVSSLLCSAMRKLGVKTQAQLVMKMRGLEARPDDA